MRSRETVPEEQDKTTKKRRTKIKFEVIESKLSLLLKHNIMRLEKHSCEQLLCTYNHSAIKVIKVSK